MTAAMLMTMAVAPTTVSADNVCSDTILIPERAVVLSGDRNKMHKEVVAVMYSVEDLDFHDPRAPRFLFLDRSGKVALGIGGYVKGTMSYDFDGAIDGIGFATGSIPVPANPALRNIYQMDASHSTVFLKLVGHNSVYGPYSMYVQTNFTGGSGGLDLKLKQAYMTIGHFTAGLTRSTFVDASGTPTIDPQGPSGEVFGKNLLFQYAAPISEHFKVAVSIENPSITTTISGDKSENIRQRCPDIPVYLQYGWGNSSHLRLSAIIRSMSYRNLVENANKAATGWGIQLSGQAEVFPNATIYYDGVYGKGIGNYINDLSGAGYDLISSGTNGKMKAPGMAGFALGMQYNITSRFFVSGAYSQCRLYDQQELGPDAYRYGQYVVASAFYTLFDDCQAGLEYNWGKRTNLNHAANTANRLWASIQYSF